MATMTASGKGDFDGSRWLSCRIVTDLEVALGGHLAVPRNQSPQNHKWGELIQRARGDVKYAEDTPGADQPLWIG